MERALYIFRGITRFCIGNIAEHHPRLRGIRDITLDVEAQIPHGRCLLILMRVFPPFGRPGDKLRRLLALREKDIDRIYASVEAEGGRTPGVEVWGKAPSGTIFVRCRQMHVTRCGTQRELRD